jgi:hypothetical protein
VRKNFMFKGARAKQAESIGRRPDRNVVLLEEIGERSDVVLMGVGDENAGDTPAKGLERAEIGVNDVDPEAAMVERDATIDEEHPATLFEGEAVHAHLAEAPERTDAQGAARFGAHSGRL